MSLIQHLFFLSFGNSSKTEAIQASQSPQIDEIAKRLKVCPCLYWTILTNKGSDHLAHSWGVLADFWVPNEIEIWNFQHMLLFWFHEASQNLSLIRQLFCFIVSKGGPKEKCWKKHCIVLAIFQNSSFGPPLETMKKKLSK